MQNFMKKSEKTGHSKRDSRAKKALAGLVDLYLKTGKPVGSETLKENGFEEVSSATLRNYFAELEKEGLLMQPHASGGRIPTHKALSFFVNEMKNEGKVNPENEKRLRLELGRPTHQVASYLQKGAELLSEILQFPIFLSSMRFDQDFILDVRLVSIDKERILCILISSFGQLFTETLFVEKKVTTFSLKRIESYFQYRLRAQKIEPALSDEEREMAEKFYNEFMVRYLTFYANFSQEDIYCTGFSRLLAYPEFSDPLSLSSALALFENSSKMRLILSDCESHGKLRVCMGADLSSYGLSTTHSAVIAIPYYLNHVSSGAIGLLGPCRMPYPEIFATMKLFSDLISDSLTKSLYKFKLSFRHPRSPFLLDGKWNQRLIEAKKSHE